MGYVLKYYKKYGIVPKSAMPETYSSSNTSEINKILKRILRMYAYELRTNYKRKEFRRYRKSEIRYVRKYLCNFMYCIW